MKQVTRYQCSFCTATYDDAHECLHHEAGCINRLLDQENYRVGQSCINCGHNKGGGAVPKCGAFGDPAEDMGKYHGARGVCDRWVVRL